MPLKFASVKTKMNEVYVKYFVHSFHEDLMKSRTDFEKKRDFVYLEIKINLQSVIDKRKGLLLHNFVQQRGTCYFKAFLSKRVSNDRNRTL